MVTGVVEFVVGEGRKDSSDSEQLLTFYRRHTQVTGDVDGVTGVEWRVGI